MYHLIIIWHMITCDKESPRLSTGGPLAFDTWGTPYCIGRGGAKHSPPGNTKKFHENHEILKVPRNHPGASRIIREASQCLPVIPSDA